MQDQNQQGCLAVQKYVQEHIQELYARLTLQIAKQQLIPVISVVKIDNYCQELSSITSRKMLPIRKLHQTSQVPQAEQICPSTFRQSHSIDKQSIINLTYRDQISPFAPKRKEKENQNSHNVPIKFKKQQKMFTQKSRENLENAAKGVHFSRLSTQGKPVTHRYNPVKDNTLVQYFYTQKESLQKKECFCFTRKEGKTKIPGPRPEKIKTGTNFRINKNSKPYEISNQCGRNASFNDYDMIGCQMSLSPSVKFKNRMICQKTDRINQNDNQKKEKKLNMRNRLVNLDKKVLQKTPNMIKMGTAFRTSQLK